MSPIDKVERSKTLYDVLLELRFPPSLHIQKNIESVTSLSNPTLYYVSRVAKEFPLTPGLGWQFQSLEGHRVKVFEDRFELQTNKYLGYSKFSEIAIKLIDSFCRLNKIFQIDRLGLAYRNALPVFKDTEGRFPLSEFVVPLLDINNKYVKQSEKFSATLEQRDEEGGLILNSSFQVKEIEAEGYGLQEYGLYLFELDAFIEEFRFEEDFKVRLDQVHSRLREAFEAHTKEAYYEYMKVERHDDNSTT